MNTRTLTQFAKAVNTVAHHSSVRISRHCITRGYKSASTSARTSPLYSVRSHTHPHSPSFDTFHSRSFSIACYASHGCGKSAQSLPCGSHKSLMDHHLQPQSKTDDGKDARVASRQMEHVQESDRPHPCDPCPVSKGKGVCDALQCWSCAHFLDKNQLFCLKCSRIQPPQEANYFDMFGLTPSFDVDLDAIQKKYWQLSKQVHPDRFNKGSEQEQHFSASQTMLLNTAYNTLKQPHLRAVYLLSLNGIEISESESLTDEMFLMEIMEIRECVETAHGVQELQTLKQENEERIQQCLNAIEKELQLKLWERAKGLIAPLQYYMKIRETIVDKMPM